MTNNGPSPNRRYNNSQPDQPTNCYDPDAFDNEDINCNDRRSKPRHPDHHQRLRFDLPISSKRVKMVDDYRDFTNDLQDTVHRTLPTGRRRYNGAAILAVDLRDICAAYRCRKGSPSTPEAVWMSRKIVHRYFFPWGSYRRPNRPSTPEAFRMSWKIVHRYFFHWGSYRHPKTPSTPEALWMRWKIVHRYFFPWGTYRHPKRPSIPECSGALLP